MTTAVVSARMVNAALRRLRTGAAPASLTARVYERLGLADAYVRVPTVIGAVYAAYGRDGVAAVRRAKSAAAFEAWYERAFGAKPIRETKPVTAASQRLRKSLAGTRGSRLRVDLRGLSTFERAVLEKTREIPRGEVRPYSWVARAIGHPYAVRAVGNALAKNPVPLLIPCHRVVRGDGAIGGYAFGSAAKRALLAYEGAI